MMFVKQQSLQRALWMTESRFFTLVAFLNTSTLWIRPRRVFYTKNISNLFYRCIHPAQQHGRRIPPLSLDSAFSIRITHVSAFLPEMTQQIHSLRARGVIPSQRVCTFVIEVMAFCKSAGILCTVPEEICFVDIRVF